MTTKRDQPDADEWLALLDGGLSAQEEDRLVKRGLERLHDFLAADPLAERRLTELLERRLGGPMDADTWDAMNASLSQYFGQDLACLLYWVVAAETDMANRLERIEGFATPPVLSFLRAVIGIYGIDITHAFDLWQYGPDNWRVAKREILFDAIEDTFRISVTIEKFSGEEMMITGVPDSILRLATSLVYTAALLPGEGSEPYAEESVGQFVDECAHLLTRLDAVCQAQKKLAETDG